MATAEAEQLRTESQTLFRRLVISIWVVVAFYCVFYVALGTYVSAVSMGLGVVLFSPLILFLESKGATKTARALFLLSCNFYIYTGSLGLGHQVKVVEYFCVPALLLALLVTDIDDIKQTIFGGCLPIVTFLLTEFVGPDILPPEWRIVVPMPKVFIAVNFFSAYSLTAVFLIIFTKTIKEQRVQMISSAKMSSLGEMASGIAHEINNPLTVISGRASMVRNKIVKGVSDSQALLEDVSRIEITAGRIAKIVNGLRAFSRSSEKDPMVQAAVKDIVDDTIELCRERFRSKAVELKIGKLEGLSVRCRPVQISQVYMNLLGNALDAVETQEKPWVELSGRVIDKEKGSVVQLSVLDSGLGIPDEIVEKMMQPFFTTKEVGKGTGLGLSISKGIVEDHGGELYYTGESGHTCFIMELPVQDGPRDIRSPTN